MKVLIIVVLVAAAVFGVVKVLGSTLAPAEYQNTPTAVRGALARGALSRADRPIPVWTEPRPTSTRKERIEMRVGDLNVGEKFVVVKHFQNGAPLWILIESQDRDMTGWIVSTPQDPVHASLVEK